jgi:hypothetical protein
MNIYEWHIERASSLADVPFMLCNFNYYRYDKNDIHTSCSPSLERKLPAENMDFHQLIMTLSLSVEQAKQQPLIISKHWCHQ